jgi:hypothetical protein
MRFRGNAAAHGDSDAIYAAAYSHPFAIADPD